MASRNQPQTFGSEYFDSGYHYYFDLEIEAYDKYLDFAITTFSDELRKLSEKRKQDLYGNADGEYEDFIKDDYIEQYSLINTSFNRILLDTLLIQYCTFAETKLFDLCDAWATYTQNQQRAKDLKIIGELQKIEKYFSDFLKLDILKLQPAWGSLKSIKLIRNSIVHDNGRISKTKKNQLEQELFLKDKIKFNKIKSKYQLLIIDSQLLKDTSIIINDLFQKISSELE